MAQTINENQLQQDFLRGMLMVVTLLIATVLAAIAVINAISQSGSVTLSPDLAQPLTLPITPGISASQPFGSVAPVRQVQTASGTDGVISIPQATAQGAAGIIQPAASSGAIQTGAGF